MILLALTESTSTNVTDRQTHRHRMTAYKPSLCIASRGNKSVRQKHTYT